MEIISHRGLWKKSSEKNTLEAFKRSFSEDLGTETDIRDFDNVIKIAHDPANKSMLNLEQFLDLYNNHSKNTLALNIKADGLQNPLFELLKYYRIKNYFFFDMSIPDTILFANKGLNFFLRSSEYETPDDKLLKKANGIWLDCFNSLWYDKNHIINYLEMNKKVAIVSEELHGRDRLNLWKKIIEWNLDKNPNIILCTDYPLEAREFFKINLI